MGLAEDDDGARGARFWLVRAAWSLAGIAGVVGIAASVQSLISAPALPARQLAKISLVPDSPPPPPPPKEERRQEPPKEQEKQVHVVQTMPKEAPPQPTEQLKMEGTASDTGIAGVQAGAVTQEYQGQTIGGTGSGGTGYAWYGGVLQREVQTYLQRSAKLRGAEYRVTVRIWLSGNGELSRVELGDTTGNPETDEQLKAVLAEMPALKQPPPAEMPQPIKLRVTSRA